MAAKMLQQVPSFLRSIKAEHTLLDQLIRQHGFNAVISDNRYGLHSEKIPCVFITHQLFIQTPGHLQFLTPLIDRMNHRFIRKFNVCWIPDMAEEENLSGDLSHKRKLPFNHYFIGPLSRFDRLIREDIHDSEPFLYDVLVILSGPEPQRTILEQRLLSEIRDFGLKAAMVCGKPGSNKLPEAPDNCDLFSHLPTGALLDLINRSEVVIARSGYSTIMDLAATGKKAVLVPTPGQTEQEYLGVRFEEKGIFHRVSQEQFSLPEAVAAAGGYTGLGRRFQANRLEDTVREFLALVGKKNKQHFP
jgi:uncharacterized protein (TIGR00661 family)